MSFFQIANPDETIRVHTEDGEDFIELKSQLSKAEFNKLALNGPRNAEDTQGGLAFMDHVVQALVVGWSFKDSEGKAVDFDMRLYRGLTTPAANWISTKAIEQFNAITKVDVEEAEGKPEE